MTTPAFTANQRAAVEAGGSAMVRAGAGSGKTAVLTARYVRALVDGARPGELLAMTFTEKAAAEMRGRIRVEIRELALGPVELARLQEDLVEAHIGTIHSFCTTLLRQFAVEAGVDPDFEVADESIATQLKRRAADAAIETAAGGSSQALHEALELLLSLYTRRFVAGMLFHVFGRQRYFPGPMHAQLASSPEELLAIWQQWLDNAVCATTHALASDDAVDTIRARLSRLLEECTNPDDTMFMKADAVVAALTACHETDVESSRLAADALANCLFDKDRRPRSYGRLGNKKHWPPGALDEARGVLAELTEHASAVARLGKVELDESDTLIARLVSAVWRLVGEMGAQYDALKGNGRALDFDDLESRAVELLESTGGRDVLDALRGRYRLILVDEAQDLNLHQFRLISLLAGEGTNARRPALFAVGDPQQSIFGFRNAEVRLFAALREALILNPSDAYSLDENFRSAPALVAFANRLFVRPVAEHEAFDVAYAPMRPVRTPSLESTVELHLVPTPDPKTSADEKRAAQARALAARVGRLCGDEGVTISDHRGAQGERRASFGDIAVLVRTRLIQPLLLQELRARGIPCSVYKGTGFYQSQEVRDVFTALRFLADESRDLELAGLLRSPFFSLSDDGLYALAYERGDCTLYDALRAERSVERLSRDDQRVLERARALIPRWRRAVNLVAPSHLLQRMLDESGAWGTYAAMGVERSLVKLLRVVRELERGRPVLARIVDVLDERIRTLHREGDEPGEAVEADAVTIMTIHAAKGLQFPIVFLVGLDDSLTGGHRSPSIRADADLGFAVDTPRVLQDARAWTKGAAYAFIAERAQRKALAEARRLLYVACTRARDHLCLVGTDLPAPEQSWQRWLIDAFDLAPELDQERERFEIERDGSTLVVVRERVSASTGSGPTRAGARDAVGGTEAQVGVSVDELARLIAPIAPQRHLRTVTVSQLVDYARCPRLYYARHIAGLALSAPPTADEEAAGDERPTEDIEQSALGRVVHALLEHVAGCAVPDIGRLARGATRAELLDAAAAEQLGTRAARIVEEFLGTALGRAVFGGESMSELPFALRLDETIVLGRIDRLVVGAQPWVVDFKLPRDPAGVTQEKLEAEYGLQLQAYALAASRLLGAQGVCTTIILPEIGRSFDWSYDTKKLAEIEKRLTSMAAELAGVGPGAPSSMKACGVCAACRQMPDLAFTRV